MGVAAASPPVVKIQQSPRGRPYVTFASRSPYRALILGLSFPCSSSGQPYTAHTTKEFAHMYMCVICLFTRLVSVIPYPAHRARVLRFLGA